MFKIILLIIFTLFQIFQHIFQCISIPIRHENSRCKYHFKKQKQLMHKNVKYKNQNINNCIITFNV